MKKAFQKSGALLMAFFVLFSTMSFTVEKHFCGTFLIDTAVFSEPHTCGMETTTMGDSCCNEKEIAVDGQDQLQIAFNKLDFQEQVFLASFAYTYINLFQGLPEQVIPFKNYSPPLLVSDTLVLDQTFLI